MYLVCPKCLRASASVRRRSGFRCSPCQYAWEPPAAEFAEAYYHGLDRLSISLVSAGGEQFSLSHFPTVLGRNSGFGELQRNPTVSSEHFRIDATNDQLTVTDLQSSNGTFLNGKALPPQTPVPFALDDVLGAAGVELRLAMKFRSATAKLPTLRPAPEAILLNPTTPRIITVGDPAAGAAVHLPSPHGPKLLACLFTVGNGSHWRILSLHPDGVRVNGQSVLERALESQDEIGIGPYRYLYLTGEGCLQPLQTTTAASVGLRRVVCSVFTRDGQQIILDDVSVIIPAGKLTAIIGPSGSGKSTIVKILTGALTPDSGDLLVDGQAMGAAQYQAMMHGRIAFVPQDDMVHQELSIQQTMEYAASLRLPGKITAKERMERIARVLQELELEAHREKLVNQLSGGQRKRVNVAVELISSPSLLFLDEPTTGLDFGSEQQLIQCLRRLAHQGRTVAFVTHSLAIVEQAEHVVFVRSGRAGGRVLAEGSPETLKQEHKLENWAVLFNRDDRKGPLNVPGTPAFAHPLSRTALSFPQLGALCLRYLHLWAAHPLASFLSLLALPAFLGILIRIALPNDGPTGKDRFLFGVICAFWMGMNQTVREIVKERSLMLREWLAGINCPSYLFSKAIFFWAIGALQALALLAPMVWLRVTGWTLSVGLSDFSACPAYVFWLVLWLGFVVGACVGLLISSVCLFIRSKGEIVSVLLVILVTLPQILFSEKILGKLVETSTGYYAFGLTVNGEKLPEFCSYLTVSRYLYLPLVARNNRVVGYNQAFLFNTTILLGLALICFVLSWIALELFVHRQKRETHW